MRFRLYVTANDLRSSARAAVRNLRLAKPDAQWQKKWQPPEALILRRLPQPTSTSSTSSSDGEDEGLLPDQPGDPHDGDGVAAGSHGHTSVGQTSDCTPCDDTDGIRCSGPGVSKNDCRSPCLTPRLVPTVHTDDDRVSTPSAPGTPATLIATPSRAGHSDDLDCLEPLVPSRWGADT
eukprot:99892-Pyramimonas_sp.AAC.1